MNNGLLGFPAGDNSGSITGLRRWWNYLTQSNPVPGMPSRTNGVWYKNDSGGDLLVNICMYSDTGNEGGIFYVAPRPVAVPGSWNSLDPVDPQAFANLGLVQGPGATTYMLHGFTVPANSWYMIVFSSVPVIQLWAECRTKP